MSPRGSPPSSATLRIERLTPGRMNDLGCALAGSWGRSCWCMYPRLSARETRELPGEGSEGERKRLAMTRLARRKHSPGLLAYAGDEVAGWVAVAPRKELHRIEHSRATPRVDDLDVWVIPCITVRKGHRGRGIAITLIRAACDYAFELGAPAVEAYPRAGNERTKDDNAYYGTQRLFRKADFKVVRPPLENLPPNWTPRVTMRRGKP